MVRKTTWSWLHLWMIYFDACFHTMLSRILRLAFAYTISFCNMSYLKNLFAQKDALWQQWFQSRYLYELYLSCSKILLRSIDTWCLKLGIYYSSFYNSRATESLMETSNDSYVCSHLQNSSQAANLHLNEKVEKIIPKRFYT